MLVVLYCLYCDILCAQVVLVALFFYCNVVYCVVRCVHCVVLCAQVVLVVCTVLYCVLRLRWMFCFVCTALDLCRLFIFGGCIVL